MSNTEDESHPPPPAAFDPGWNDPPKFSYNPNVELVPKVKLNKRIAFPMGGFGNSSSNSKLSSSGLPMPFSNSGVPAYIDPTAEPSNYSTPPPPPPSIPLQKVDDGPEIIPSVPEQEQICSNKPAACKAVGNLITVCQTLEDNSEILSRLSVCQDQINEDALPAPVLEHLIKIIQELESGEFKRASELLQFLMVNHIDKCKTWGTAIRKIIFELECKQKPNETADSPLDDPANVNSFLTPSPLLSVNSSLLEPPAALSPAVLQHIETELNASSNKISDKIDTSPPTTTDSAYLNAQNQQQTTADDSTSSIFRKIKSRILHI